MTKRLFYKYEHGFTLIEVGISILVLSFALLAIAEMQIIAMQGSSFAHRLSQSTTLAQDRVESLMLLQYNHSKLEDVTPAQVYTTYADSEAPPGYSIEWHVDANVPSPGKKTINVDVSWRAPGGIKHFTIAFVKSDA